ncbi:hypothetical protein PtB15_5B877 [Puccinia triticina]|nr:hypothetical protein PtB15_5B877 [Puccinia triticina]
MAANNLIPAPPERDFGSRDECLETIQKWAFDHGFAIATARLYTVKGQNRVVYQCDKSGPYRPHRAPKEEHEDDQISNLHDSSQKPKSTSKPTKMKKERGTIKTNCSFRLTVTHNAASGRDLSSL